MILLSNHKQEMQELRDSLQELEGLRNAAGIKARALKMELDSVNKARSAEGKELEKLRRIAKTYEESEEVEAGREAGRRKKEGEWVQRLEVETRRVNTKEGEVKAALADSAAAQREAGLWRGKYEESQRELVTLRAR